MRKLRILMLFLVPAFILWAVLDFSLLLAAASVLSAIVLILTYFYDEPVDRT